MTKEKETLQTIDYYFLIISRNSNLKLPVEIVNQHFITTEENIKVAISVTKS